MTASVGDWIIIGVAGEIYPCREDIFNETYEILGEKEKYINKIVRRLDYFAMSCFWLVMIPIIAD